MPAPDGAPPLGCGVDDRRGRTLRPFLARDWLVAITISAGAPRGPAFRPGEAAAAVSANPQATVPGVGTAGGALPSGPAEQSAGEGNPPDAALWLLPHGPLRRDPQDRASAVAALRQTDLEDAPLEVGLRLVGVDGCG